MSLQAHEREGCPIKVQLSGQADGLGRYIRAVERVGAVPVPGICPRPDPGCDALVLCGGGDLDPALFGQENHGSHPPDRVLGICRGMQVLNVFLGGTLIQDLQPAWRALHQGEEDVYHSIRCRSGSLLERLLGPCPTVNSAHHQAVDRLGKELAATAWAPEGFAEGIEHSSLPVLGVQFHPERLSGPGRGEGGALFEWLVHCVRK